MYDIIIRPLFNYYLTHNIFTDDKTPWKQSKYAHQKTNQFRITIDLNLCLENLSLRKDVPLKQPYEYDINLAL